MAVDDLNTGWGQPAARGHGALQTQRSSSWAGRRERGTQTEWLVSPEGEERASLSQGPTPAAHWPRVQSARTPFALLYHILGRLHLNRVWGEGEIGRGGGGGGGREEDQEGEGEGRERAHSRGVADRKPPAERVPLP